MRVKSIGKTALLLVVVAVMAEVGGAQGAPGKTGKALRPNLALDYTYVRSNAPPGGCDCFNLNGGSATFAWPLAAGRFALAGDITAVHAGAISSSNYDLTLSSYTAGVRYLPPFDHWSLRPFGQVLVGVAHASGSLVQGQYSLASNAAVAFAANLGGGLDLHASRRFSVRLVEADYLVTTIDNGSNNHQNNLRLSTGVVFHF
jgi:outer membrane immunogenic protein